MKDQRIEYWNTAIRRLKEKRTQLDLDFQSSALRIAALIVVITLIKNHAVEDNLYLTTTLSGVITLICMVCLVRIGVVVRRRHDLNKCIETSYENLSKVLNQFNSQGCSNENS